MSRARNTHHLIAALADRRQLDNARFIHGQAATDRLDADRISQRIDLELDRLGLNQYDLDDFEEQVQEEVRRRRSQQRRTNIKRQFAYTDAFAGFLAEAGIAGAR